MSSTLDFDPQLPPFRVQAFGGGVQSVALLYAWGFDQDETGEPLFFDRGDQPDVVIFSDTKQEPESVYTAVDDARHFCETIGVQFEVVAYADLAHPPPASTGTQGLFTPLYSTKLENDEEGPAGKQGRLFRQCTGRFKIDPMMSRVVELAGRRPIEVWLGMTIDEAHRMRKAAPDDRIQYRYPLVYQPALAMSRHDCANYMADLDIPTAKSACVFCPNRRDGGWALLAKTDPAATAAAVEYDRRVRRMRPGYELFVHDSRKPLEDVLIELTDPKLLDLGLFPLDGDHASSGGCDAGFCGS
jgi:hypothetical protein